MDILNSKKIYLNDQEYKVIKKDNGDILLKHINQVKNISRILFY